ncbi:MAG: flagellar hook-length control protein FliK [Treponema sp.]|nr:flagellar hook-length control protein FliK [Treponema sp.]
MIEISPYTEDPRVNGADERVPVNAGKKEASGARENSGASALGVFAKILAGLSVKTAANGREGGAEDARTLPPAGPPEDGEHGPAEGLLRGLRRGKNAGEKDHPKTAGETGALAAAAAGNAAFLTPVIPDAVRRGEEEPEPVFPARLFGRKSRAVQAGGDEGKDSPGLKSAETGAEAFVSGGTEAEKSRAGPAGAFVPEIPAPGSPAVFPESSPALRAAAAPVPVETAEDTLVDFSAAVFPAADGQSAEKAAFPPRESRGEGTRGKKREKAVVVEDLRAAGNMGREAGLPPETVRDAPHAAAFSHEAEMIVELRGQKAPSGDWKGPPAGNTGPFEHFLARELQQGLSDGIVREARLVLRDGGEGTIRLSLKPESLGNVKIRLEMAENKITGHVVVESEEALRAFERETHSLEQAFLDSGFDGAELDFSLAQGGQGGNERREDLFFGEWKREAPSPEDAFRYEPLGQEDSEFLAGGVFRLNGRTQVNMLI